MLKRFVDSEAEVEYQGNLDYIMKKWNLDTNSYAVSLSEEQSQKSIIKLTNDVFIEL